LSISTVHGGAGGVEGGGFGEFDGVVESASWELEARSTGSHCGGQAARWSALTSIGEAFSFTLQASKQVAVMDSISTLCGGRARAFQCGERLRGIVGARGRVPPPAQRSAAQEAGAK